MQILERRTYRGPNLYAHFPVIRLNLDLGELEHHPSATIPGFVDALIAAIPSLQSHTCSYGEEGGFIRRMREQEGTWLGHVLDSARRPRLISLTQTDPYVVVGGRHQDVVTQPPCAAMPEV